MKTLIVFALVCLDTMLFGQIFLCENSTCQRTGSVNISTGVDNLGNVINPAQGAVDPNWRLINNPPLVGCTNNLQNTINGNAYVVNYSDVNTGIPYGPNNWTNQSGSSTIGPIDGGTVNLFGCDNASDQAGNPVPYIFERQFCVCTQGVFSLNFSFKGDDELTFQLVDLTSGNVILGNGGTITFSFVNVNQVAAVYSNNNVALNPGTYALRAFLANTSGTTLGFSVVGQISSAINSLMTGANCCSSNSLVITKILDRNCNGIIEAADQAAGGWTFNVFDANGAQVGTGITDNQGSLIVNNLTPGTYTVTEQVQAGWVANQPLNGTMTVQVTNGLNQVTFLNCREEIPPGQSCCPELRNLIENGDFSHGNSGFHSNYLPASAISPNSVSIGEYAVVNSGEANTICPNWNIEGHTPCPSTAGRFLVVNGETNQQTNAGNVIWGQSVFGLQPREDYVFCASFKNLSQCCFDVQPRITVQYRNLPSGPWITLIPWTTINEDASDRCAWEELSQSFTALTNGVRFRILIDETSAGDGNDLAIDDISLHHQLKQQVAFTIKENYLNSSSFEIEASIQNPLPGAECLYYWQIAELSDPNDPFNPNKWIDSDFGGTHPIGSANPLWGLTTKFPGGIRNGVFDFGKDYLICLYVEDCTCFADGAQRKKIIFYSSRRGKSRQFVENISWDSVPLEKQEILEKYLDKIEKNRDF